MQSSRAPLPAHADPTFRLTVNRKTPPADPEDTRADAAPPAAEPPGEQTGPADFERSLTELEAIVEKLEQGELSLEESLRHFERGVQLTRVCQKALRQAEQKVEILMRKSGGGPDDFETAPFEPSGNDRGG